MGGSTISALSGGLMGYSVYQGEKAKKEAKKEIDRQKNEMLGQEMEMRKKKEAEDRKRSMLSAQQQTSMMRAFTARGNRGGTLLTGGLTGSAEGGKQLLGS
jgi:hypothetical protein